MKDKAWCLTEPYAGPRQLVHEWACGLNGGRALPFGTERYVLAKVTHGIVDTTHRHQECSCYCEPPINSILLVLLIVRGRLDWVILRASTHIARVRGTDSLGLCRTNCGA